jgi:hypothetical protein
MAETKTNNLGSVQRNLTAAYNARKKREDLYKKGYAVSPDKAKRDEYAAIGAEMDANYNTGFQEIRRLEEEAKSIPKFRSLTSADNERLQKIKEIKKQIPLQTRLAQELLPNGLVRSREIAPLQEDASAKEVDLTEEEIPTITVSKPKRKIEKLYRVMYAGKNSDASEVYETKEEADAALKKAGGKGAVAGVNMSQETRGGEILPTEDVQARKQKYVDQLSQTKQRGSDRLQRIQALRNPQTEEEVLRVAENKGRMEDAWAEANKAKLAEDKKEGRDFAEWKSGVRVRRESQNVLNDFNRETGLLKNAYNQALQSNNPLAALQLSKAIRKRESGIPKEMGARKKFFEEDAVRRRDAYLAEVERQAQEEERINRLYSANPDARDFM